MAGHEIESEVGVCQKKKKKKEGRECVEFVVCTVDDSLTFRF